MKLAHFVPYVLSVLCVPSLPAASTITPGHRHAYGANIGWIDCRADGTNGMVVGSHTCRGFVYSANCGWIDLGNGAPTNGVRYSNADVGDFGVNHDGRGNLRGYAYGANIGWLVFEERGRPSVDLLTGVLSGYAYGANVGWVSLSNSVAHVQTGAFAPGADRDRDQIPDNWETERAGSTYRLRAGGDADGDGAGDWEEFIADTNPLDARDYLYVHPVLIGARCYAQWAPRGTRIYRVEVCDDLAQPAWEDSGRGVVRAAGDTVLRVPMTGQRGFLRVQAMLPIPR